MIYIRPDYYDAFHCTADRCRHSCCVGWEIDIDAESLDFFNNVSGSLGEKLRRSIDTENEPHFILDKNERCPFLTENGLCELIIALGEDSLCDICTEHPRFYNQYGDVFEKGLGMCCEEAERLLLDGTESVKLIVETDGEGDCEIPPTVLLRGKVFDLLSRKDMSFSQKENCTLALLKAKADSFDASCAARFCLTLERMESVWGEMLSDMALRGGDVFDEKMLDCIRYERICEYFVYRHFAVAEDLEDAVNRLKLCFFATRFVCCLEALGCGDEALRMFSAEIEYSDENIEKILRREKNGR